MTGGSVRQTRILHRIWSAARFHSSCTWQ
jgi:hypothetical protein